MEGNVRIVDVQEGETEAQATARERSAETCPRCKGKMEPKDVGVCFPCGSFVKRLPKPGKAERAEEVKRQAERAAAWAKELAARAAFTPPIGQVLAQVQAQEKALPPPAAPLEASTPKRTELLAAAMKTAGIEKLDTPANVQRVLMAVAMDQRSAVGLAITEAVPDFRDFIGMLNGDKLSEQRWIHRVNEADSKRRKTERRVVAVSAPVAAKAPPELKAPQKALADALDAAMEISAKGTVLLSAEKGRLRVQFTSADAHLAIGIPCSEGGAIEPIRLDVDALRKAVANVASRSDWVHLTRQAETLVLTGKHGTRTVGLTQGAGWRADLVPGPELAGQRLTAEVESFPLELAFAWAATSVEDTAAGDTLGVNGQLLCGKAHGRMHVAKLPFSLAAGPAVLPLEAERAWSVAINGFGGIPNDKKVAVSGGSEHVRFTTGFNEVSIILTFRITPSDGFKLAPEVIAREYARARGTVELPAEAQGALESAARILRDARKNNAKRNVDLKVREWTTARWQVGGNVHLTIFGGAADKPLITSDLPLAASRGENAPPIDFGLDPQFVHDCIESDDYGVKIHVAQYEGHGTPYIIEPSRKTGWEHFALVMPLVALPGYRSARTGKEADAAPVAKAPRKRTPKAAK